MKTPMAADPIRALNRAQLEALETTAQAIIDGHKSASQAERATADATVRLCRRERDRRAAEYDALITRYRAGERDVLDELRAALDGGAPRDDSVVTARRPTWEETMGAELAIMHTAPTGDRLHVAGPNAGLLVADPHGLTDAQLTADVSRLAGLVRTLARVLDQHEAALAEHDAVLVEHESALAALTSDKAAAEVRESRRMARMAIDWSANDLDGGAADMADVGAAREVLAALADRVSGDTYSGVIGPLSNPRRWTVCITTDRESTP